MTCFRGKRNREGFGGGCLTALLRNMKLLIWNPPGLGNPRGFWTLHEHLLTKVASDLVFLQETKVRISFFYSNKFKLSFQNAFVIDCVREGGGLALLWKDDVCFEELNFSIHHIHGLIIIGSKGGNRPIKCTLTGVYGQPNSTHRPKVWNLIYKLGETIN